MSNKTKCFDVIIVGAGPAGTACALRLKDSGLSVAMLDKQSFPRDKVCGDAIPGRAIKILHQIDPVFASAFKDFDKKFTSNRTRFMYNRKSLNFQWVGEAYTCARINFDNFLFTLVKNKTQVEVYECVVIKNLKISENKVTFFEETNDIFFEATMIIGADGAQSLLAKLLTARTIDRDHHVGSVRSYYKDVTGTVSNTTEVFFEKKSLPSYLWVFPLPGNVCNVGFGMLSSTIARKKINLRAMFFQFIKEHPELNERFKNAEMVGELEGFGLPLGSRKVIMSGDNFLLVGDAASLIDPFSGEGIGNAMLSGKLAAEQVIDSFKIKNFSAEKLSNYDTQLMKVIGKEMKLRYKAQQLLAKYPFLLDIIFKLSKNKMFIAFLQKGM